LFTAEEHKVTRLFALFLFGDSFKVNHSHPWTNFLKLRRRWSLLMNVSNVNITLQNFSSNIVTSSASSEFFKINLFHNLDLGVCFDVYFALPRYALLCSAL